MQDLESSISIRMSFVKIYLNDIREIIKILDELRPSGMTLQAEKKSFSLEEIKDLKKERISELKIISHHIEDYYDITINFDKFETEIYCHRKTNEIFGICKKIEDYLKKKKRFFDFIARNNITAVLSGAATPIIAIMSGFSFGNRNLSIRFIIIYFLVFVLFVFSLYLSFGYKNIIILKEKEECKNWLIKNKDQLIMQTLVGILLIVFGILIGNFFNKK